MGDVCIVKVLQCCRWFDGAESVEGFDWWDDMRKRLKLAQHMGNSWIFNGSQGKLTCFDHGDLCCA